MMATNDRKFASVGTSLEIFEPVALIGAERLHLGSRVRISEFVALSAGLGTYLGNFVHLASHTCISGGGICVIGDFVGICAGAKLITGSDDPMGASLPTPLVAPDLRSLERSFVHCEAHSFVGTNAVIHPGVTVGEGAVIGSGAVVTRSVEPWAVYVGAPARKVKERDPEGPLRTAKLAYERYGISPTDWRHVITQG